MSAPKFTPGPWKVIESGVVAEGKFVIARIYLDPLKEENAAIEESIANAHLIAAAPDLYRELELARFTIAMEIATMGPRTLDREEKEALIAEHPAIKSIDAALKKARGE